MNIWFNIEFILCCCCCFFLFSTDGDNRTWYNMNFQSFHSYFRNIVQQKPNNYSIVCMKIYTFARLHSNDAFPTIKLFLHLQCLHQLWDEIEFKMKKWFLSSQFILQSYYSFLSFLFVIQKEIAVFHFQMNSKLFFFSLLQHNSVLQLITNSTNYFLRKFNMEKFTRK